jgi:hypothetical protein
VNAALIVVLVRDITRAEREGRCTPEYMARAEEFMKLALTPSGASFGPQGLAQILEPGKSWQGSVVNPLGELG